MKQALLTKTRHIDIENNTIEPNIQNDNEVLVRIKVVTVCGSDLRYYKTDKLPYNMNYPLILGHEASGVVEKVGAGVKSLKPGDYVAIEPGIWCGKCDYCKLGKYNFCENMKFMASKGYEGALQEKIVWPEKCLWKLDKNITLSEGALLEPTSVAYNALENLDMNNISKLLILGAGSIGLLIAKLLNSLNKNISYIFIDKIKEKINLINKLGLTPLDFICDVKNDNVKLPQVDAIIDTTGNFELIDTMLRYLYKGGYISLIGISEDIFNISIKNIIYNGFTIKGNYRYKNSYPVLINMLRKRMLDLNSVITERYTFDKVNDAFKTAMTNYDNIKIAIDFDSI